MWILRCPLEKAWFPQTFNPYNNFKKIILASLFVSATLKVMKRSEVSLRDKLDKTFPDCGNLHVDHIEIPSLILSRQLQNVMATTTFSKIV